ncbi:MAG TPA: helix-turn-helix domain-containing protein [Gemmatimonadaceae bacterium]
MPLPSHGQHAHNYRNSFRTYHIHHIYRMPRDRSTTRARILAAAEQLLATDGFSALGVNAIAARAGVDKVLIYRYFGGLPQLLAELARDGKVWPPLSEVAPEAPSADDARTHSLGALALLLLRAELAALRERPLAQQALAWELADRNALTDALAAARAARHDEMLDTVRAGRRVPPYVDVPTLMAILGAGLTYLALMSRTSGTYLGLDLSSDESWHRVDKTLAAVVRAVLETREM